MFMPTAIGRPNNTSIGVPESSLQLTRWGHFIILYFLKHIYEKVLLFWNIYHEMLMDLHVFSILD
jgi:hypothetical protein